MSEKTEKLGWNRCVCEKEPAKFQLAFWKPNGELVKLGMSLECLNKTLRITEPKEIKKFFDSILEKAGVERICSHCGSDLSGKVVGVIGKQIVILASAYTNSAIEYEKIGDSVTITKEGQTGGAGKEGIITAYIKTGEGICAMIITKDNDLYQKLKVNFQIIK